MSSSKYDSLTIDRLLRAWNCVLSQFQKECADTSLEHDAGISLFKFLPSHMCTSVNCEQAYIPKENYIFDSLIDNEPFKESLLKLYDPRSMYLISVHVPVTNTPNSTVGTIRAFEYDTHKEIEFHKVKKEKPQ